MDNSENTDIDKTPLLKEKKKRPPPSEKQMENFKKMAQTRAENIKKRKEEKIYEAKRTLLIKEGLLSPDEIKKTERTEIKEKSNKEVIQFEVEDNNREDTEEEDRPPSKLKKTQKNKPIPLPLNKPEKIKKSPPAKKLKEESSDSSDDYEESCSSSSSEEIIIVKRTKKVKEPKVKEPKVKEPKVKKFPKEEEERVEEYVAPSPNYLNYFL
jgi:hypothetical protein